MPPHRLQELSDEGEDGATAKLEAFDQHVAHYKEQMYFAITARLMPTTLMPPLRNVQHLIRTAEEEFDAVLETDRAPWLRSALNAMTWAVSVILSLTVPFAIIGVAAMHWKQYTLTGDFGFFARAKSSRLLHEGNLRVTRLLEDTPVVSVSDPYFPAFTLGNTEE